MGVLAPFVRIAGRVRKLVSTRNSPGYTLDTSASIGRTVTVDVYPSPFIATDNLSADSTVGISTTNARVGDEYEVTRNSASPAAYSLTVKSGTHSGGSTIGSISASKNGSIVAYFDGSAWKLKLKSQY